ncbi:MAG: TVP38/TMEM64 family protein [Planctomycetes bacterium]|nr:TVP38/TMEM64 family protein [Planctomycetota bacterium]
MGETTSSGNNGKHTAKIIKIIIVLAVIGALVAAAKLFDLKQGFRDALDWISGLGPLGPLIFIGLYILVCVLLLPGSIVTLGAGVVFGVVKGSIAVSIGSTIGATCAFLIGRYLARNWVAGKIAGNEKFKAIDEAVASQGWKIVLLTRLSPVFPFNLLNYAFGLTKVSLKHYFFASWIGMIPGTIMYVYIGSLAGDLAKLGTGQRTRTTGEWVLYGAGLLATLVVTVFVTRLAKKALATHIPLEKT